MKETANYDVVDSRAPRTYQAIASALIVVGWLADQSWILGALSLSLAVSASGGMNLPYRLYFSLIQPRLGAGTAEDKRAPTFAQAMASTWLFASFVCIQAGAPNLGWGLALTLAAAAALAAATGFCLGCYTYRLLARARRIEALRVPRIDPADVPIPKVGANGEPAIVGFSHPLCHECQIWDERLAKGSTPYVKVDVRERPELAKRYGIALVPTILEVAGDGKVLRQLAP
jgi:hypothetical protein